MHNIIIEIYMKSYKSQIIRRKFGNNFKKLKSACHGIARIRTDISEPQTISSLISSS